MVMVIKAVVWPNVKRPDKHTRCKNKMPTIYSFKNGSKTETAANTMTYDNVEVPDSQQAKKVYIVRAELDVAAPDYVAASNTATIANVIAGKTAPTDPGISEAGAITSKSCQKFSTGAAGYAAIVEGPDQAQGRWEVFKNPSDGKFYFTVGVKGVLNTGAKTAYYRVDFEIEV